MAQPANLSQPTRLSTTDPKLRVEHAVPTRDEAYIASIENHTVDAFSHEGLYWACWWASHSPLTIAKLIRRVYEEEDIDRLHYIFLMDLLACHAEHAAENSDPEFVRLQAAWHAFPTETRANQHPDSEERKAYNAMVKRGHAVSSVAVADFFDSVGDQDLSTLARHNYLDLLALRDAYTDRDFEDTLRGELDKAVTELRRAGLRR